MTADEPWIKASTERLPEQWHMPAGAGSGYILSACDRRFDVSAVIDRRDVGGVPAAERCPVCQGVFRAREAG